MSEQQVCYIEVYTYNQETKEYEWRKLRPGGENTKPYEYTNIVEAWEIAQLCFPFDVNLEEVRIVKGTKDVS